jgi:hypothetical protein
MRRQLALTVFLALLAGTGANASPLPSPLAFAHMSGDEHPELVLAQRAIAREWPAKGDSGFVWFERQRSEVAALALSAALPGAGQLYAGERRGLAFAAAEALGWLGWILLRRNADGLRDDARLLAGSPEDSASAWSFERWEDATLEDASHIRALYAADREAFEAAIGEDGRYASGWSNAEVRAQFGELRGRSDRRLVQSRVTEGMLWVNHVLAALDAVRAARMHNVQLTGGVELRGRAGWAHGAPTMRVVLQRRFW